MGAAMAAAAGGAAGGYEAHERAKRIEAALKKEFKTQQDRATARAIWEMIEEAECGSLFLSTFVPFFLAFIGFFIVAGVIDDHNWGGIEFLLGCVIVMAVPFGLGAYFDRLLVRGPKQRKLDLYLLSLDPKKDFERRVRHILQHN